MYLRKSLFILIFFWMHLALGQSSNEFVDGSLYFKFKDKVDIEAVHIQFGAEYSINSIQKVFKLESPELNKCFKISFDSIAKTDGLRRDIESMEIIEYCELIPIYNNLLTPNDLGSNQLSLNTINAQQAWDQSTGDPNIVIAIIDDAVRIDHEDLAPNIWVNPGEIPGNGIDDDINGYIDDINGYDVAHNDSDPMPPSSASNTNFTHGTHCAGISSARSDNGIGMASIGSNCSIMAVKTKLDNTSGSSLQFILEGIQYAISAKADVVSMSFGSFSQSATIQYLIDFGHNYGIVFVAAAGNNNLNTPFYPAAYDHVISVGATDLNDNKASFSNYGNQIDVMAPGVNIYSTLAGATDAYGVFSGTSMACPMVSGLVGLMLSKNNTITPDEIEACLENTCINIDGQNPSYIGEIGAGRIDANLAMLCVPGITAKFSADYYHACPGSTINFTDESNNNPTSWNWDLGNGIPSTSTAQHPSAIYSSAGMNIISLTVSNSIDTATYVDTVYIEPPSMHFQDTFTIVESFSFYSEVEFEGVPPFSFEYTDGVTNYTETTIFPPYFINHSPMDTVSYTPLWVTDASCTGSVSGSVQVNVLELTPSNCNQAIGQVLITEGEANFQDSTLGAGYACGFGVASCSIGDLDQDGVADMVVGGANYTTYGSNRGAIWVLFLNPDGTVKNEQRISNNTGGLPFLMEGGYSSFGISIDTIGDYNNDGVVDLIVGQSLRDDGGVDQGAAWILLLNTDGTINGYHKLGISAGNVTIPWQATGTNFGTSVSFLPDMTGNGINEIVVGDRHESIHILFMGAGGICDSTSTISSGSGTLPNFIPSDAFGNAIISPGDLNNDNIPDLIVGDNGWGNEWGNNYSPNHGGRVFFIYLNQDGTVLDNVEMNNSNVPVNISIPLNSLFGSALEIIPDLNGDGNLELLVARRDSVYLFFLDSNQIAYNHIVFALGGFGNFQGDPGYSNPLGTAFGSSLCYLGDLNGDNNLEIGIGQKVYGISSIGVGAQWIMSMNQCNFNCSLLANFSSDGECLGDSTFFMDLSSHPTDSIDFWHWDFGDGNSVTGIKNPGHLYASDGTYNVTLIIGSSSQNGCMDTTVQQITIYSSLNLNYVDSLQVCPSIPEELPFAVPECGQLPYSYAWTPSIGLSDPTVANPIATITLPTMYYVTITDVLGDIALDSIFIDTLANCCFSHPDFTTDKMEYCIGDTVLFSNNSLYTGTVNYSWTHTGGGSPSSNGTVPINLSYSTSGIYETYLYLQDDCGQDSLMSSIIVRPHPAVDLGLDTAICIGESVEIGVTTISNHNYFWTSGNVPIDSVFINSVSPLATELYSLSVTDEFGCLFSDSVTIYVNSLPIVEAGLDQTVCLGNSTTLNGSGSSSYTWNNGVIDGVSFNVLSTTTFVVTGIDNNGCENIDSLIVTVIDPPIVVVSNDVTICEGELADISATGATSYDWNNSLGAGSSHSVSPVSTTDYSVIGFDGLCFSQEATVTVTVNPLPNVSMGVLNEDTVCINFASMPLPVGTPLGGTYSGNGVSGSTFDPSIAGVGSHIINYHFVDGQGCSDSVELIIVVDGCLGIISIDDDGFRIYPNPADDFILIERDNTSEFKRIEIIDEKGKIVFEIETMDNPLKVSISEWPTGTYFVQLTNSKKEKIGEKIIFR